jgi:predicted AAA+ superfamily ATPase
MNDKGTMSRLTTVNTLKQRLAGERQMLSPALIKDYLDKLADSYLLFTVPIRSYNTAIQAVNPKKVYAIDHAIAQAFSQATSDNAGLILENMVFIELKRSMKEIWYYKTEKGDEIDFAVGPDSDIRLLQVCWTMQSQNGTRERECEALFDGMRELELHEGWIITAYDEEDIINEESGSIIHVIPAYKWLLEQRSTT